MEYYSDDRVKINNITMELVNMQSQQKQNQYELQVFRADYESIVGTFGHSNPGFAGYPQV